VKGWGTLEYSKGEKARGKVGYPAWAHSGIFRTLGFELNLADNWQVIGDPTVRLR
jgi:hypothetical protein